MRFDDDCRSAPCLSPRVAGFNFEFEFNFNFNCIIISSEHYCKNLEREELIYSDGIFPGQNASPSLFSLYHGSS